ncbi:MAG: hypothetical protein D6812_15925 [Deltaproteobacteria bacterium]|nr:MAG: hypothetical protein D6812_15925 [Deltaproteobacteria bacterium]
MGGPANGGILRFPPPDGGVLRGGHPAAKSPGSPPPSPLADEAKGGRESVGDRLEEEESS